MTASGHIHDGQPIPVEDARPAPQEPGGCEPAPDRRLGRCRRSISSLADGCGLAAGDLDNDGRIAPWWSLRTSHWPSSTTNPRVGTSYASSGGYTSATGRHRRQGDGRVRGKGQDRPAHGRRQLSIGRRSAAALRSGQFDVIDWVEVRGHPGVRIGTLVSKPTSVICCARANKPPPRFRDGSIADEGSFGIRPDLCEI